MARPTKNAEHRLSHLVIFRLDDENFDGLSALAARAGMGTNDLARRLTCTRRDKVVIETYRRNDPAYLARIDRIAHNLNQLVKSAHIFGRIAPEIGQLCQEIQHILDAALEDTHDP